MNPSNAITDCTQMDLPMRLRQKRVRDAQGNVVVNPETVAELKGLLRKRAGITAEGLRALRPAWDDRHIREMASSTLEIVSGPGTQGYTLFDEAEDAEVERAARKLMSQGRKMFRKGAGYLRKLALRKKLREEIK